MSIVRMQKLTLLSLAREKSATLDELRKLGVLHVKPFVPPAGKDVDAAKAREAELSAILAALPAAEAGAPAPEGTDEEIVGTLAKILEEKKARTAEAEKLANEIAHLAPFGEFKPEDAKALAADGIVLKLYRTTGTPPALPEGVSAHELSGAKKTKNWALFGKGDFAWEGAEEVPLPQRGLASVRADAAGNAARLEGIERELAAYAPAKAAVEKALADATAARAYAEVASGMAEEESIACVQGFLPADAVEPVRAAAKAKGWGIVIDEPTAKDDVPVVLRQPKWAKPIQAVFEGINILPAYNEADVSVVFMLFFSLFFAMIIGDAGYGAIFLCLTLLFAKKMTANVRNLLLVTSSATIVWGLITGSVFGIPQEWLASHGFAKLWPEYLNPLRERSAQNVMGMCFLIGAIQITIGHLWNVCDLVKEKSTKALEQIGWTLTTWYMFFMADNMVIGGNMAKYLGSPACLKPFTGSPLDWACILGIAMIALFMLKPSEIKDGWFNLALLPLNIINNFTDVVSYVRLYAVGAAGFAVANAFNTMIFGGKMTIVSGIFGAVLVFLAHTLNILLCVMGVLVHGIRLNTLEFSNHKGISWSGTPYRPFRRAENTI